MALFLEKGGEISNRPAFPVYKKRNLCIIIIVEVFFNKLGRLNS